MPYFALKINWVEAFCDGTEQKPVVFPSAPPLRCRNGSLRTASTRPLLGELGAGRGLSQPAIAVHRPSDAYSAQLFIKGLVTERQSEAAWFFFISFPLCFFKLDFLPPTSP